MKRTILLSRAALAVVLGVSLWTAGQARPHAT
jgi:hypothetical protein